MNPNNRVRLIGVLTKNPKCGRGKKVAWAFVGLKPDGGRGGLDVKAFGGPAEVLADLGAGSHVCVEAHLEMQKPKTEGAKWELAIVADEILVKTRVEKEQSAGGDDLDGGSGQSAGAASADGLD